jgi:hypothetical protein
LADPSAPEVCWSPFVTYDTSGFVLLPDQRRVTNVSAERADRLCAASGTPGTGPPLLAPAGRRPSPERVFLGWPARGEWTGARLCSSWELRHFAARIAASDTSFATASACSTEAGVRGTIYVHPSSGNQSYVPCGAGRLRGRWGFDLQSLCMQMH